MAIIKSQLVSFVNSAMDDKLEADDLDEVISLVLSDMSDSDLLVAQATPTDLADGTETIAYPTGYRRIRELRLKDSSGNLLDPLVKLPEGIKGYWEQMAESEAHSTPVSYAEWNEKFYIYPPADGVYEVICDYYRTHPDQPDEILFADTLLNCMKFGCAFFRATMQGRDRYINIYGPLYGAEKEKKKMMSRNNQPYITKGS